eukprot:358608-Chlamydomonas_euryale.AAC.3
MKWSPASMPRCLLPGACCSILKYLKVCMRARCDDETVSSASAPRCLVPGARHQEASERD